MHMLLESVRGVMIVVQYGELAANPNKEQLYSMHPVKDPL